MADKARKQKHVLCIDGGGFRGYTCLVALRYLMYQFSSDEADGLPPCQLFDVICGTSTGGLIAVLLGRLGLDCVTAMSAYKELVTALFEDVDQKGTDGIAGGEVASTEAFEEKLSTIVEKYTGAKDTLMRVSKARPDRVNHPSTDTFVTVVQSTAGSAGVEPYRVRSYAAPPGGVESVLDRDWTICEVICAATALPGYFKPVDVGPQSFQDATLSGSANPVWAAISEVELRWSEEYKPLIVSLGTGLVSLSCYEEDTVCRVFGSRQQGGIFQSSAFAKQLLAVARDTELEHRKAAKHFKDKNLPHNYIRFDPTRGLGDLSASDVSQVPRIEALTNAWLDTPEGRKELAKAFNALKQRYKQIRMGEKQQSNANSDQDCDANSSGVVEGPPVPAPVEQNDVSGTVQQVDQLQQLEGGPGSESDSKSPDIPEGRQDAAVPGEISSPIQQPDDNPTEPSALMTNDERPDPAESSVDATRKNEAKMKPFKRWIPNRFFKRKLNAVVTEQKAGSPQ